MNEHLEIMIVAGEASGDAHGAKLVNALREATGANIRFFGAAGHKLREAGVQPVVDADGLAIVGLPEIGKALPMFWKAFRDLKKAAIERKPDVVILVDFPDFNLKLAKSLKKRGCKIVYYISPQLWAWRKYRVNVIRKYADLVISILPFEKDWYARQGIEHVEYVGSPLSREVHADTSKEEFCARHGFDPARPIISLLPGSRHKELARILPVMLNAAELVAREKVETQFIVALASVRKPAEVEAELKNSSSLPAIKIIQNATYDALNASDAAAIASGTATLETGIIGTPMAIVYKTSALNYKLLRPLISVEHFGLINLIAGQRVAKELIQDDFTPRALANELLGLLEPSRNLLVRTQLKAAADKLGHGGASKRAAETIVELLQS